MKLSFAVEPLSAVLPAILYYEKAHAEEVNDSEGRMQIDLYEALERAGALVCIAGRGQDGFIYAYYLAAVCRALHAPYVLAETKLLYADPTVRGSAWRPLLKFAKNALAERGAKKLYTGLRLSKQVPLFERLGYRQAETIMEIDLLATS